MNRTRAFITALALAVPVQGKCADGVESGVPPPQSCTIKDLNLFQVFNKNTCGIASRVIVGVELDDNWHGAMRNLPPHINLKNFIGTDEELLREIVSQLPAYSLSQSENIFSIAPKNQGRDVIGKQLDKTIPVFKTLNAPLGTAFNRLIVKARESGFAITSPAGEIARDKGRALEDYLPPGPDLYESHLAPVTAKETTVNLIIKGNPSLRQILNSLLRSQPPGYWFAVQNREEVLVVLNGTRCRPHGCSGLPIATKGVELGTK